jgi:hypothetical protein
MYAALRGAKHFRVKTSLGGCLKRATFCSALPFSLNFRRFRQWRAASASVLLGNHLPALFFALWLLVNSARVLALSTALTRIKLLYKCHTGH